MYQTTKGERGRVLTALRVTSNSSKRGFGDLQRQSARTLHEGYRKAQGRERAANNNGQTLRAMKAPPQRLLPLSTGSRKRWASANADPARALRPCPATRAAAITKSALSDWPRIAAR